VGPFGTIGGTRWDPDAVQDHAVFERWNTLSNGLAEDVQFGGQAPGYDHCGTPFHSPFHVTRGSCMMRPIGTRTARYVRPRVGQRGRQCRARRNVMALGRDPARRLPSVLTRPLMPVSGRAGVSVAHSRQSNRSRCCEVEQVLANVGEVLPGAVIP
jgi:hypothetical protein